MNTDRSPSADSEETTPPPPQPPETPAHKPRRRSVLRELPVLIVVALVISLLLKAFIVQAFFIPSGSMEKTLHGCPGCRGDRVIVNKLSYRVGDIKRGQVIVFKGPSSWPAEVSTAKPPSNPVRRGVLAAARALGVAPPDESDFIKRVIGLPGDTVRCCDAGHVQVNGRSLNETYLYQDDRARFGPVTVPKGKLWVMGDHRSDSADSRANGPIPVKNVIGHAVVIVWPVSRWARLPTPSTFGDVPNGNPRLAP
jgi:signal peptidase I